VTIAPVLASLGVITKARVPAFCPACRWLRPATAEARSGRVWAPGIGIVAFVGIAAAAALTIAMWLVMPMYGMDPGLGSPLTFAANWSLMMTAMMLPSALPLVIGFARSARGREGQWSATLLVAVTYIAVWTAAGLLGYAVFVAIGMPWQGQILVGGGVLGLAALYSLTPFRRRGQARCRLLCALHGPLPFQLHKSAVLVGVRYGLSCIRCSGLLMAAMLVIGMSSVLLAGALTVVVLGYKFAPLGHRTGEALLAIGIAALAVACVLLA
jgi:predicted metal-binding membrane protein